LFNKSIKKYVFLQVRILIKLKNIDAPRKLIIGIKTAYF